MRSPQPPRIMVSILQQPSQKNPCFPHSIPADRAPKVSPLLDVANSNKPNNAFTFGFLGRYSHAPTERVGRTLIHVVRCNSGTQSQALTYGPALTLSCTFLLGLGLGLRQSSLKINIRKNGHAWRRACLMAMYKAAVRNTNLV
jgi:hypothetical protein